MPEPLALHRYATRAIALKDGRVVKGTHFIDLRDAGDPVELAQRYNDQGADEVVFLDITASKENRGTMLEVIGRAADQLFLPLTVGGGIRSDEDIQQLLRAGADKVSVNTSAVLDPSLIARGASRFGTQCIVLAEDVRRNYRENPDAIPVSEEVAALPDLQGSGLVRDLQQAAELSPVLQYLLTQYSQASTRQEQMAIIDQLLYAWADTSGMAATMESLPDEYLRRAA